MTPLVGSRIPARAVAPPRGSALFVLSAVSFAVPTTVMVVVMVVVVVLARRRAKGFPFELRSLNVVDAVLVLAKFAELNDIMLSQSGRQAPVDDVNPWAAISGRPKPVVSMEVVVPAVDEKDIVGYSHRHIHGWSRQEEHCWSSLHDHRRRRPDVDIDVNLSMCRCRQESSGQHHKQQHATSIGSNDLANLPCHKTLLRS